MPQRRATKTKKTLKDRERDRQRENTDAWKQFAGRHRDRGWSSGLRVEYRKHRIKTHRGRCFSSACQRKMCGFAKSVVIVCSEPNLFNLFICFYLFICFICIYLFLVIVVSCYISRYLPANSEATCSIFRRIFSPSCILVYLADRGKT